MIYNALAGALEQKRVVRPEIPAPTTQTSDSLTLKGG